MNLFMNQSKKNILECLFCWIKTRLLQVGVVQYSDTPRLEIPLGKHQQGAELIQAIQSIDYLGGNTQVRLARIAFKIMSASCS